MSARRDRGFTLVELLVALALVSAIGAVAFGNLRFGLAAWNRQAEAAGKVPTGLAAHRLAALIEGARMTTLPRADFGRRVAFRGDARTLHFLRSDRRVWPGLSLWRVRIEGRAPALRLVGERIGVARPEAIFAPQDWGTPVFVLDGLDSATFAYAPPGPGAPAWRTDWIDAAAGPALVRLKIVARGRLWTVVAHPGIGE